MLYDNWTANMDEEGVAVFLRGYEKRGPNNERKRTKIANSRKRYQTNEAIAASE